MPTYMYVCDDCEHRFELSLPSEQREKPLHEQCPSCGAEATIRRDYVGQNVTFRDPASLGLHKPDREFRDLMGTIKQRNRGGGNIDRYT